MSYLLRLAWRNTLRNRRRSLLTLVAIFLGIAIFVAAQSLIAGIEKTMIGTEVDAEEAHLRIMSQGFAKDEDFYPLDLPVPEAPKVATLLRQNFAGAQVTLRSSFSAKLGDGTKSLTCRGVAIDRDGYRKMFNVGDLPLPKKDVPVMWLGADIANAFGKKPGQPLTLQAKTSHGAQNALTDVVIGGVLSVGHPLIDNYTVFVPMSVARELLDIDDSYATEVMARFADPEQAEAAARLINSRWPNLKAETWREKTEYIVRFNDVRRTVFNIVTLVLLLMAAVGVANTSLMSGFERTTEIGTFLALGLSQARVMALFVLESLFIGIVGIVLGLAAGGGPSYYLERVGVPFPAADEEVGAAVPIPPRLYFDLTGSTLTIAVLLGLTVVVLAALYPAWKVSRTDPILALKVEG